MTPCSEKEVVPYEPVIEKQLRQMRKERNLPETLEKVGQSSTNETMAGDDHDNVDLSAREAVQQQEKVQLDAKAKEILKLTLATIKKSVEQLKNDVDKNKKGKKRSEKKKKEENLRRKEHEESKHMPSLPFPQKLYREKLDKQFEKYFDMMKHVHVNLPFIEVLSQMPAYDKFLKEILTKKRKIEETSVVKLTEQCSAIFQNKLPQKCGDLGSSTIPCSLGTINFDKSLCDSGASINLLPFTIYRKPENEIGEIRSALISLQLVDQTTLIPKGIVEDIFVRVDKFGFPVDFIVVEMEENKEVPLILGKPFLANG
uniref:Uncharacterized protein LOC104217891 n=1 Tax=Nicotiana sylvestris TaxID=4096 RepID=A0A1U7VEP5_NICSY|nr:PREDICTED: uncharacterized protein LOC104217891 [Nicotiana sylvestris]